MPAPTGKWLRLYRGKRLNESHDIFIDDKGNRLIFIDGGEFFIQGDKCIYTDINSGIEKSYKIIESECPMCDNGYITERQDLEKDLAMISDEVARIRMKDGCKYCGTFHCTCYGEL